MRHLLSFSIIRSRVMTTSNDYNVTPDFTLTSIAFYAQPSNKFGSSNKLRKLNYRLNEKLWCLQCKYTLYKGVFSWTIMGISKTLNSTLKFQWETCLNISLRFNITFSSFHYWPPVFWTATNVSIYIGNSYFITYIM